MTESEYYVALAEVTRLCELDPMPDTDEGLRLAGLSLLIESYEREHFPAMFTVPEKQQTMEAMSGRPPMSFVIALNACWGSNDWQEDAGPDDLWPKAMMAIARIATLREKVASLKEECELRLAKFVDLGKAYDTLVAENKELRKQEPSAFDTLPDDYEAPH